MKIDQFWEIVERVHTASPQDMDAKCELLGQQLLRLSPSEVQSFESYFTELWQRAFRWEVWDAAYIILGGCSDDSFMDFRSVLISMGRRTYEAALSNADSLADVEIGPQWASYEGYQCVAPRIYREMTGNDIARSSDHPSKPNGVETDEWDFGKRYPKLAAKFGHKDEELVWMKERAVQQAKRDEMAKYLASLMLDAGLIPPSGVLPPMSVLANVLRTGRSPDSAGGSITWAPLEMDEPLYWRTVIHLERMPPDELVRWRNLNRKILRQDLECSGIRCFDEWIQSLAARGVL
jgi:hypothetical protein